MGGFVLFSLLRFLRLIPKELHCALFLGKYQAKELIHRGKTRGSQNRLSRGVGYEGSTVLR